MTKAILLIGIGGGVGSIFRYLTSLLVTKYFQSYYSLATLLVNIIGCLLIGLLIGIFDKQEIINHDIRLLLITGFCGGFTTFSAFASENFHLFQSGNSLAAYLNIGLSVFVGLFAVWLGVNLIK